MKMKRGVVAQLIYMLVLIAIAVVVGLFFMNIVEKNKKTAAKTAVAEVQFEVLKNPDGTLTVRTSQDPGTTIFYIEDTANAATENDVFSVNDMTYTGMYYEFVTTNTKCDAGSGTIKIVDNATKNVLYFQASCDKIPTA